MAKAILISLSNPVSPDRDQEFNDWFNNVHGAEVTNLAGFESMTRYRAVTQVVPPGGAKPAHQYLALYEVSDIDIAVEALVRGSADFAMSDAVDLAGASGIAYEQIFTTNCE